MDTKLNFSSDYTRAAHPAILSRLAAYHEALQGYVSSTPQASQRLSELGARYAAAKSRLAGLHTRKGLEGIAAEVNQIGRQYYEECIRYGLAGLMSDVIFQLRDYAQNQNERLFDVVVTVLAQLDSIFRSNANILTQGTLVQEGSSRSFSWDALDVSSVSDVVRDKFAKISSGNVKTLISGFTNALWAEAEVISPGDDIRAIFDAKGRRDVIIADECQFLTPAQIDQLRSIVDEENVPVLCFGLRTDFRTCFFKHIFYSLCFLKFYIFFNQYRS